MIPQFSYLLAHILEAETPEGLSLVFSKGTKNSVTTIPANLLLNFILFTAAGLFDRVIFAIDFFIGTRVNCQFSAFPQGVIKAESGANHVPIRIIRG